MDVQLTRKREKERHRTIRGLFIILSARYRCDVTFVRKMLVSLVYMDECQKSEYGKEHIDNKQMRWASGGRFRALLFQTMACFDVPELRSMMLIYDHRFDDMEMSTSLSLALVLSYRIIIINKNDTNGVLSLPVCRHIEFSREERKASARARERGKMLIIFHFAKLLFSH